MDAPLGEPLAKRMRLQATCAECDGFYADPVLMPCGTSFCRACAEGLTDAFCPDCGADFQPGCLISNPNLARLVELAKTLLEQEKSQEAEPPREAEGGGGDSEEPQVFCKQEKTLICMSCYDSEKHQGHEVVPADLAAKQYKSHLRKCLVRLKREEKAIKLNKSTFEVECKHYIAQISEVWEKTKTEFQQMEKFLERQQRQLLAQVTEVYKEIKTNKNEQISALSKKHSCLRNVRCELDGAIQLSGGLLENIGFFLQTFENRETVQCGEFLSSDLQNKVSGLIDFNKLLLGSMKHFRDQVTSGLKQYRGITTPNSNGSVITLEVPITSEEPKPVITSEEPPSRSSLDEAQPSNPGSSVPQ